jgi:uncharacterized RDD family membrane protein YckC
VLALLIGDSEAEGGRFALRLDGAPFLVFMVLSLGYYFVCEAVWGRTLGKLALAVRVAAADGSPAGPGQVAIRTLLRLIDGIFFYLVGLIAILASGDRRQRIGDLAGKTFVVRA